MRFASFAPTWAHQTCGVASLSTERAGGVSRAPYDDGMGGGGLNLGLHVQDNPADVLKNRQLLRSALRGEPIWLDQVHGGTVIDADILSAAEMESAPQADAIVASVPGRVCIIQTADCLPVLFCSADGGVVGAAHAGWRGLAAGVLQNTVREMRRKGASEILAWLGPAIGPEKFEVGAEVLEVFRNIEAKNVSAFRQIQGEEKKFLADIYLLASLALDREGVSHITGGKFCTVTEERRFYSYRRDRVTGRMASLVWIEER